VKQSPRDSELDAAIRHEVTDRVLVLSRRLRPAGGRPLGEWLTPRNNGPTRRCAQGTQLEGAFVKKKAVDRSATGAAAVRRKKPLNTPTDLAAGATRDIAAAMNGILADVFALYLKTKNFHWHMSGPHFRDYHVMLDEQSDQIYAMTDPIAERIRKVGGSTLRSIGHIARIQRIADNDADYVEPSDMLAELREDNKSLATRLRQAHDVCDEHHDIATASLIEVWIDETERRTWFLFEAGRPQDAAGR
jgi:starvation-inducible DNA-binding protein